MQKQKFKVKRYKYQYTTRDVNEKKFITHDFEVYGNFLNEDQARLEVSLKTGQLPEKLELIPHTVQFRGTDEVDMILYDYTQEEINAHFKKMQEDIYELIEAGRWESSRGNWEKEFPDFGNPDGIVMHLGGPVIEKGFNNYLETEFRSAVEKLPKDMLEQIKKEIL